MAVVAFQTLWIEEMFMTAIFMSFSRNGKRSRKRKVEIKGKYNRKALADGGDWTNKMKKRIECRLRHMIVRYFASEWCTNSLFQKEKIYRKGSFSLFPQSVPAPQNHRHLHLGLIMQWGNVAWLVSVCSGEMTGKFRKVASHSAPESAFGLLLNLPEGSAPWNPGTPIVVILC